MRVERCEGGERRCDRMFHGLLQTGGGHATGCDAKMKRKLTRRWYTKTKNPLPEDDGCDAPRDDQSSEAATQLSRWPIR